MTDDLLTLTDRGLYCEAGDFHIDPWRPVERAVVTHAHADHARSGSGAYLAAREGRRVLRLRVGPEAPIETLAWGETRRLGEVSLSLHPAGHVLGSAQVRIERRGETWVVSGDYKREPDPTCTPFEPIRCHVFVTESTFGLPIFRWDPQRRVFAEIDAWWQENRERGRASLLLGYSLGKAQRLLAGIDSTIAPIYSHGAIDRVNRAYRRSGVSLPPTRPVADAPPGTEWQETLILAPPSALGTPWTRRFGELSAGLASGWMRLRGTRRRRSVDRGFTLSDHVDWPGLLAAIDATGAERVWATHGYREPLVRWLRERGIDATSIDTRFEGESLEDDSEGSDDTDTRS